MTLHKIAVIGTGYVGLTAAIGLANFGSSVLGLDIDREKISALHEGRLPFYEPGMNETMRENVDFGRLRFSHDLGEGVRWADFIFIAVGTPQGEDGNASLEALFEAGKTIADNLNAYKTIVVKSTVPVGTNQRFAQFIREEAKEGADFDVVSNPEFLREGRAMYDFLHPDRVVIGSESERPLAGLKDIYRPLYLSEVPFIFTDSRTAEMIKYASNGFLAMKVAYINEIARLCDAVGANVKTVGAAIGRDGRIGAKFLHPGPGFGGSCFPKDTSALVSIARDVGVDLPIVRSVIASNDMQKQYVVEQIARLLDHDLRGQVIAVLGLSFKPDTDDMRDAPSVVVVDALLGRGAAARVFDPQALPGAKARWKDRLTYAKDEYAAAEGADALVILTEWNQFRNLDLRRIKALMRGEHFFDFRNIYNRKDVESCGLYYVGMGT